MRVSACLGQLGCENFAFEAPAREHRFMTRMTRRRLEGKARGRLSRRGSRAQALSLRTTASDPARRPIHAKRSPRRQQTSRRSSSALQQVNPLLHSNEMESPAEPPWASSAADKLALEPNSSPVPAGAAPREAAERRRPLRARTLPSALLLARARRGGLRARGPTYSSARDHTMRVPARKADGR